jgi:hypothetical protein
MTRGPHAGKNMLCHRGERQREREPCGCSSDFIDRAAARGLYSRFMDVFPPEAHA